MSRSTSLSAAEQAREAYRQKRLARARQNADPELDSPTGTDVLLPIPGDVRTLWPRVKWGEPLTVTVPASTALIAGETLKFYIGTTLLETRPLVNPDNDPAEREYSFAADQIAEESVHTLSYRHINSEFNEIYSFPLLLTVDHTPPNNNLVGAAPGLPQEIIDEGLTLEYLDSHATVDVTVPRSSDILAGETIQVFWGRPGPRQDPGLPVAFKVLTEADAAPGAPPIVIEINSDVIKTLQDGTVGVLYRYIDRTGNLGQLSVWTEVYVDLALLPENLVDPVVPLAPAPENLIDRADAQMGVTVEIPEPGYDNQKPGDFIQVIWEGIPVPPRLISAFPMEIPISWRTLSQNGHNDQRSFKVSYEVLRGPKRTPSNEIDVSVDFRVAGPDPAPVDPGPIHPSLPLVVVRSRVNPPVDNVLGEADKNQPARAEIPSNPVVAGETLRLYWGSLPDPVDEVTIITEQPTDVIPFEVPWADIEAGGYSDKLPVYYSTWNGVNEQESERTLVDVRIVDSLLDVVFPDREPQSPYPTPLINCCSKPWEGVRIQVPGDPVNFALNDTITVSWQAYQDRNVPMPTMPIPSTAHNFPVVTLDDDKINNGFELTLDYDYVEPVVTNGSGIVTYILTKSSGPAGSSQTLVWISRQLGSGGDRWCSEQFPGVCD